MAKICWLTISGSNSWAEVRLAPDPMKPSIGLKFGETVYRVVVFRGVR